MINWWEKLACSRCFSKQEAVFDRLKFLELLEDQIKVCNLANWISGGLKHCSFKLIVLFTILRLIYSEFNVPGANFFE